MQTKALTGTGLLLAIALISQSIRSFLPIPPVYSMFLIGSLVGACTLIAAFRYGLRCGLVIAWVTPFVAFMQGMLIFFPFTFIVGFGASLFVVAAWVLRENKLLSLVLCPMIKAAVLYGGFKLLFLIYVVPAKVEQAILFSMSWPQLVTGILAMLITWLVLKRVKALA